MKPIKNVIKNFDTIYNLQKYLRYKFHYFLLKDYKKLIDNHFKFLAKYGNMNKKLFEIAIGNFSCQSITFFETGSSANWGANSSLLFDSYVNKFGGKLITVDIREDANRYLNSKFSKKSFSFIENSLDFIKTYDQSFFKTIDLVYLDSYDLDINNPEPSMNHCLQEFLLLDERIKVGSLIAIDDTPNLEAFNMYMEFNLNKNNTIEKYGYIPGKGTKVLEHQIMKNYKIIYQHYGVLLQKLK